MRATAALTFAGHDVADGVAWPVEKKKVRPGVADRTSFHVVLTAYLPFLSPGLPCPGLPPGGGVPGLAGGFPGLPCGLLVDGFDAIFVTPNLGLSAPQPKHPSATVAERTL